ncbi:replication-associated recombination protein A [candidate division WOR-3 bacterium]|nr:replication-associated recombination protein A [candidate division WOR-3 bacterium]
MNELFTRNGTTEKNPLADRVRPTNLSEFIGQEHLIGKGRALRKAIEKGKIPSMILWGPPGSGKTTLAFLIAKYTNAHYINFSAVLSGIKEIRGVIEEARMKREFKGKQVILFVDEFHRFNRIQQDAFLPYVEDGTLILIGATTENPSFEINSPLLSRVKIYILKKLNNEETRKILENAIKSEKGLKGMAELTDDGFDFISNISDGDARVALNILEIAYNVVPVRNKKKKIAIKVLEDVAQKKTLLYDKKQEEHYNLISALHKSIRGSDPDAALYYLARMLESGEDPLYIARRIVRMAVEDIGLADPFALTLAVSAKEAVHFVGMPECNLALAEAVVYLATSPKSNSIYKAYTKAMEDVYNAPGAEVPFRIRNAPTYFMKKIGYGKNYKYAHNYPEAFVPEEYLPDVLKGRIYYEPLERGRESKIKERLEKWRRLIKKSKERKKSEDKG